MRSKSWIYWYSLHANKNKRSINQYYIIEQFHVNGYDITCLRSQDQVTTQQLHFVLHIRMKHCQVQQLKYCVTEQLILDVCVLGAYLNNQSAGVF